MDFFPSESKSLEASVSAPDAADPAAEVWLQPPNITGVPRLDPDVTQTVTQAMREVQGLWAELGQLRTTTGELAENYCTLLQKYGAADQHRQDIEAAFARIDSSAQTRLAELSNASGLAIRTEKMLTRVESVSTETDRLLAAITDARNLFSRDLAQLKNASDLATRTEKMLARVESVSAETDRQLAAITDARNLLSRELKQARAKARLRADEPHAPPRSVDLLNSGRVLVGAAIAAIHKTTARTSRRAAVIAALAVFAVAAIVVTWPDGNANVVRLPVIESRVVSASGLQLPELPQRLTPTVPERLRPTVPAVPQRSGAVRSSNPKVANPAPARPAGFIGELNIQSSPPGAAVFIDGKPVGETPMSSVRIRAGSHAIRIELPKYRLWTAAVQVPAGRLTRVNATLQSAPSPRGR